MAASLPPPNSVGIWGRSREQWKVEASCGGYTFRPAGPALLPAQSPQAALLGLDKDGNGHSPSPASELSQNQLGGAGGGRGVLTAQPSSSGSGGHSWLPLARGRCQRRLRFLTRGLPGAGTGQTEALQNQARFRQVASPSCPDGLAQRLSIDL